MSDRTTGTKTARAFAGLGVGLAAAIAAGLILAGCSPAADPSAGRTGSPAGSPPAAATPAPSSRTGTPADDRALLRAAERGDADAVRSALARGADLEARDGRDRTPVILAATGDHVEAARVLVKAGADVNTQDDQEDSAWLVTGVTGSVDMARTLLPGKPDFSVLNRYNGSALIPAGEHGHADYIKYVTENTDLPVDHKNRMGWTALLEAVMFGDGGPNYQRTVELLLSAGANPNLPDSNGVTPLQHAESRGQTEIANLLRKAH